MPSLEEARRRHAAHYAVLLASMRKEYLALADRDNVIDRFEAEWEQLQAGQAWASGAMRPGSGDGDLAFLFASSADPLVGLRHPPSALRAWIAPALSHESAARDPWIAAECLNRIGETHYNAGEFAKARELWQRALEMHRRVGASADPRYFELQAAGYRVNIASADERLGHLGAARAAYKEARDVFGRLHETQQEGRMSLNLGVVLAAEGAHEEAVEEFLAAVEIATHADDTDGLELALGAMGNSLADLERLPQARAALEEALSLTRRLRDKAREALRLGNLANVTLMEGDHEAALCRRADALALAKEMGDPRTEALQLHGMGAAYTAGGQEEAAERCFAEAERTFEAIGMREAATKASRARAGAAARRSLRTAIDDYDELIRDERCDEAIEALDRWVALGREPTTYQRSLLLGLYAFAEQVAGKLDRAAEHFGEALKIDRTLPQGELAAHHLGNVGDLYRQLGDAHHAELAYRAALQIPSLTEQLGEKLAYGLRCAQELQAAGELQLDANRERPKG